MKGKEKSKNERKKGQKKKEKTYESVRPQKRRDRVTTKYHGKEEAEFYKKSALPEQFRKHSQKHYKKELKALDNVIKKFKKRLLDVKLV